MRITSLFVVFSLFIAGTATSQDDDFVLLPETVDTEDRLPPERFVFAGQTTSPQDLEFPIAISPGPGIRTITGEAFSELAGRNGNLVTCRARVEIRISIGEENKEIKVDRETSVALDLAENIAATSALQTAGSNLAEQILPLITEI